ncbi:hypothetical protein PsorP6_016698 [Peronosclerospora sorghi]|uniref:Uncharacterized protein n=1 Tax=Peronosclerospora sorghi TaxID=230839 RepID=A0ACC0WGC4_9STRA|nr:hypothetical protein PsorP6_016698 [Peronosclerospora sorghi]
MVGNKHKNGIICTFPNCNKSMRTQKFKMHFIKAHLSDGEVYSIEHRRNYEVARDENVCKSVKPELVSVARAQPTTSSTTTDREPSRVQSRYFFNASSISENALAPQAKRSNPARVIAQAEITSTPGDDGAADMSTNILHFVPTSGQTSMPGEQTSGIKRPASTIETSETVDPTSVLLMQFIALMDQRFQELVGKMGEMIDVQKDLIDTLQTNNPHGQAPASAFSHAVDMVMKRRKKDTNPNSSEEINGISGNDINASGPSNSGFTL